MASVLMALRKTSTDALGTISTATSTITRTVNSVDNLVAVAEAHSASYRARTEASLALSDDEIEYRATVDAKRRMTRYQLDLNEDLKDPEFEAIFNSITFSRKPTQLQAAE